MGDQVDHPHRVGSAPLAGADEGIENITNSVAPQTRTQEVQLGGTESVRRVENLAERREFQLPSDESRRAGAEMIDGQPTVDVNVVERLRKISGFPLERIAMQKHDRC